MDLLWNEAVAVEQRLFDNSIEVPAGLSTQPEYLVKPFGLFSHPLMIISSYPTVDENSSVHLRYGTVNDLSNTSMARLYAKTGYHKVQERKVGMFHIDIFPR